MPVQLPSNDDRVVFQQDRRKLLGLGLMGIIFVAMGASFILHPEFWTTARHSSGFVEALGWLTASFFSLCLVAVIGSLARPTTVKLGPEGVTISTAWRTYSRPWDVIGDFRLWDYRRNRLVIFNDAAPPNPRLAEINRRLSGATSSMPTALNVSPEQLLTAIEKAKERWAVGGQNARRTH